MRVLICQRRSADDKPIAIDAWKMRSDFLAIRSGDNQALVRFLNKFGDVARGYGPFWTNEILDDKSRVGGWKAHFVTPERIWAIHGEISTALTKGAASWFSSGASWINHLSAPAPGRSPYFSVYESFCKEAMETTITLDFARGLRFRPCKRSDCQAPFQLTSRHKRKYCSQYCAHLESVRKNRKRKRK
jgi:hypothetical protein